MTTPTQQPTAAMIEAERAAFEAWAQMQNFVESSSMCDEKAAAWDAWQARSLLGAAPTQAPQQECCNRAGPDAPHSRWCPVHGEGAAQE